MKQLIAAYTAELLKLKRTIAILLAVLFPILFMVLVTLMALDRGLDNYDEDMYINLLNFATFLWPVIILPMFLGIESGLISSTETTTGQWKHIFCLPIPKWKVLFSKWLVMISVCFASHALFILLFMGSFPVMQLFAPQVAVVPYMDVLDFAWFFILLCVSSVGLTSIHFVFSLIFPGLVGNIGLAISAATLALGLTWGGLFLEYFPWTAPLASLAHFVDVETVFRPTVAILSSVITAAIWLIPGIYTFSRKDIL